MSKFIDQIATGDAVGAKETMSDMLSAKAFEALDARKQQIASTLFGGMQVEEVEDLEEGTMTGITLGKKVKNDEGGYDQDVHHKGKKIGSVGSYSHRTGKRYGMSHDASGDMSAGARDHKEALDDLRDTHAAYLKSMKKEEVEQLDELTGKGKLPQIADYHKQKSAAAKDKMETIRSGNTKLPVPKETSAKIYAKDSEAKYHANQAKRANALMKKEDVEQE